MKTEKKEVSHEDRLVEHVRRLYPSQEYLFLRQIRSGMNAGARTADALALGLWSSRDVRVHGFEVKASRGSWLQDLRAPEKAEEIAQYCHRWWIVASDDSMVKESELPSGWGLYAVVGHELRVLVNAEDRVPKPLSTDFMAYVIRGSIKQQASLLTDSERDTQYNLGYRKGVEDGECKARERSAAAVESLSDQLHTALKSTRELEKVLGVRFERLDKEGAQFLGNLIRMYGLVGDHDKVRGQDIKRLVDGHKFLMSQPIETVAERLIDMRRIAKDTQNLIDFHLERIPEIKRKFIPMDMLE